ncbi:MAG: phosphoribosylanthranilate isomerase [Nitrospirota bacterium]
MVKVKICGITNLEDAFASVNYGADALGFVFYSKSPRAVSPETAKSIIASLPPFVTTVGVFADEENIKVQNIALFTGLNVIQFHGSESPKECALKKKFIKAIRIKDRTDLKHLTQYKKSSAFLLDTYSPSEIGGTGLVFNWDIAVEAKKYGKIILAGGLNPENIGEAIKLVQPYGVDVSSGVEGSEKGRKDHQKVKLFLESAQKAFRQYK